MSDSDKDEQNETNGKRKAECPICYKTFTKKYIQVHIQIHTGVKAYECNLCDKKFSDKRYLKSHKSIHTGEPLPSKRIAKNIACQHCDMMFRFNYELMIHMRTHTGELPFACHFCPKKFRMNWCLKEHMLDVHTEDPKIKLERLMKRKKECPDCHKMIAKKYFEEHKLKMHSSGMKPSYECQDCGKKMMNKSYLKRHRMIHTGEKPFHCEDCGMKFRTKGEVLQHVSNHHIEINQPHECTFCQKKFKHSISLKDHLDTHREEKPYRCQTCDKRFGDQSRLLKHERTHNKQHECGICHKRYFLLSKLKGHTQSVHYAEKRYSCHLCPLSFTRKTYRGTHAKLCQSKALAELIHDGMDEEEARMAVAFPEDEESTGSKESEGSNDEESREDYGANLFSLKKCTIVIQRLLYIDKAAKKGFRSVRLPKNGKGMRVLIK